MTPSGRISALLMTCFVITGCVTARLTQFNTFAQAGITYTTASQSVITDAGSTAVSTDSALLIKVRPNLNEAQRRARVLQSDSNLRQRLQVLQLISAHAKILQAYFQALSSLSDPKAADTAGTAAQGVFDSFAKISPALKNAKMGSTSISNFIPTVAAPIVATFKVRALNDELKLRSKAIADELALQQGAFNAIVSEFKTDAQELQNFNETDSINQFASAPSLPTDWASQRLPLLSTPVTIASAEAVSKAAEQLGKAWAALVANKLDSTGFTLLLGDISNIMTIAQTMQSAAK